MTNASATGTIPPNGLAERLADRTAGIGVLGLGYVGLPTAMEAAGAGFKVTGIDISQTCVDQMNSGQSYVDDVPSQALADMVRRGVISATTDYAAIAKMDVIVVCVPTPIDIHKEPDLGPLREATETLATHMDGEQLVVLQSTTFPGTTEEMVLPQLQRLDREVGKHFYLAFSPERIDPGNQQYSIGNIPKVVGGVTPGCTKIACSFFSMFVDGVIPVSSPRIAEMTKLLENTFRSVNIALVNELSELCHRMGIDIWEVIRAAATKPFGFMPFQPGIGVGGHCIPVDPFYLSWKAKEYDFYVNFIELAARTNDNRPYHAASRIVDILAQRGETLKNLQLLLLGISFKKNIGDIRNSPALRVAELLSQGGAVIAYSDRHVPEATISGQHLTSVEPDPDTVRGHDATVILVDHSYYDVEEIVHHSKLVIDTRDATGHLGPLATVVKL